ncbi:MAG TPA: class I SAM-dependent methyltransferase [Polyangiaceae bacterium]|nr:class I SAM-dependent methyltransferase [Polyangiaceae bacterium]
MSGDWGPAFRPWLEQRILEDSEQLLVVDKLSGIPTHGGDAGLADDVVRRLEAYLRAEGRDPTLGVHQRLDLGTSGVLLFARERALGAAIQDDFERGRAKKRYVAAVEVARGSALEKRDRLTLEHRLEAHGKLRRVTPRGGQECRAECRVLSRSGSRALCELRPETGRTHQLRVQLSAVGAPIAGDRDYDGPLASRLFLHAERLELPSVGRAFTAQVPAIFARWLSGTEAELANRAEVLQQLRDAACRRYALLEQTDVLRWVNGAGDQLPGIEVDFYRGYATLAVSSVAAVARAGELAELLAELGARGVYLKQRAKADVRQLDRAELAPAAPLAGAPAEAPLIVREAGLAMNVELADGLATGLFVDQRDNRRRVRELSAGARVLNLFSYTCSFSVAAALGGASHVTSVDLSRRALRRGQDNFRLNGLDPTVHGFVCEDVLRFLERAGQRAPRFDLIVLDPPSFSSAGRGRVLKVERDYERLCGLALRVLAPLGRLVAVTNHRGTSPAALRAMVLAAARAERYEGQAKELSSGLDCPEGPEGPWPSKSVLFTRR